MVAAIKGDLVRASSVVFRGNTDTGVMGYNSSFGARLENDLGITAEGSTLDKSGPGPGGMG